MGDVAMAVPVVHAVATAYPDVHITVLSRPFARSLFEDLAPNVSFMEADIKREYRGLAGLNALYRRLTAKRITAVADLHNVIRSEYLRMRFNVERYRTAHVDKNRRARRTLVRHTDGQLRPLPTAFERYAAVFARLGYPVADMPFRSLFPPEGGNLNMLPAVIGPKKTYQQWIGIAPFAAHKGKIWPPERMLGTMRLLAADYPEARFFLFGRGPKEEEIIDSWAAQWPQLTPVSRHLEAMHQELILMSHLDCMVAMDSANLHLASLTATPAVSVWGATHPAAGFMGWRQDESRAVSLDMPCRPCSIYGNKPCALGSYPCLTGITPKMVADAVVRVIGPKP